MPPRTICNLGDTMTGLSLLRAAGELRNRAGGAALASQVAEMGRRLLVGLARHGYDPEQRIFPSWLHLDGRPDYEAIWYGFPRQKMKDEAVKRDPILQEVAVFAGPGFYRDGPWAQAAHNPTAHDLSLGAILTGDKELLARAVEFAAMIMDEVGRLTGEFNEHGQWLFSANASYIHMMLNLSRLTGESRYLDWARQLADLELDFLSRPMPAGRPEWWRMPQRNSLLEALLALHS